MTSPKTNRVHIHEKYFCRCWTKYQTEGKSHNACETFQICQIWQMAVEDLWEIKTLKKQNSWELLVQCADLVFDFFLQWADFTSHHLPLKLNTVISTVTKWKWVCVGNIKFQRPSAAFTVIASNWSLSLTSTNATLHCHSNTIFNPINPCSPRRGFTCHRGNHVPRHQPSLRLEATGGTREYVCRAGAAAMMKEGTARTGLRGGKERGAVWEGTGVVLEGWGTGVQKAKRRSEMEMWVRKGLTRLLETAKMAGLRRSSLWSGPAWEMMTKVGLGFV